MQQIYRRTALQLILNAAENRRAGDSLQQIFIFQLINPECCGAAGVDDPFQQIFIVQFTNPECYWAVVELSHASAALRSSGVAA